MSKIRDHKIRDQVYCEVHGDIHDKTTDPYRYGYAITGEEPECKPVDWRILWVGRYYKDSEHKE